MCKAPNLLIHDIFEYFKDGQWHNLDEIKSKFMIDRSLAEEIISFFARSGFVNLDHIEDRAIMKPSIQRILQADLETVFAKDESLRRLVNKSKRGQDEE